MWYAAKTIIKLFLVFLIVFFLYNKFKPVDLEELETVNYVNLNRYTGTWYEIARYPNRFQQKCVSNVKANYSLSLTSESLKVENSCTDKNGQWISSVGTAKVLDSQTNAKLRVSFLGPLGANYYIIYLDSNYRYAAVGEPKRKYLWILSRTKDIDSYKYQIILNHVEKLGYDTSKLVKTEQN